MACLTKSSAPLPKSSRPDHPKGYQERVATAAFFQLQGGGFMAELLVFFVTVLIFLRYNVNQLQKKRNFLLHWHVSGVNIAKQLATNTMKLTAHDARKLAIRSTEEYTETYNLIMATILKLAAEGKTGHDEIMELEQSVKHSRNMMLAAAYALVDDFKSLGYKVEMETSEGPSGEIAEISINWN